MIGIVVIGRNEGARLAACLASLPKSHTVIYVDSGSSDDSVAIARTAGARVIELSRNRPMSAARARNAGITAFAEAAVPPAYIQTIDGDCTLDAHWLAAGAAALDSDPGIAVVAGRLRERHPERSFYNRLCDDEWNAPEGEAAECGGVALWRLDVVIAAGLFDGTLHAGEEPELCHRLRQRGGRIWRLQAVMGTHDANLLAFRPWSRRMFRSGFAYAELVGRAGARAERHWRRELLRIGIWAGAVPTIVLAGALTGAFWLSVLGLGAWSLLLGRMTLRRRRDGQSWSWAFTSSLLNLVGKFWQAAGVLRYRLDRFRSGKAARYVYEKRV